MNTRRRFSIYTGLLATLVLTGGLLAGCSADRKLSEPGASPVTVPPSSVAYESESKVAESEPEQARNVYLNDGLTGWRVEMDYHGAFAADNTLYRTSDGGETWTEIADSKTGTLPSGAIATLRFVDAKRGWAATNTPQDGDLRLYETRDGGATWRKVELSLPADFDRSWFEAKVPILFEGTDLGLYIAQTEFTSDGSERNPLLFYVTSDGGATWSDPLRSEQGEYGGVSWKSKRLADGSGRSWSITISGRTWTFERGDE